MGRWQSEQTANLPSLPRNLRQESGRLLKEYHNSSSDFFPQ